MRTRADAPLHVGRVQWANAIGQRFVGVGGDLLKLVSLHLLKQSGQILLAGFQLSPLAEENMAINPRCRATIQYQQGLGWMAIENAFDFKKIKKKKTYVWEAARDRT